MYTSFFGLKERPFAITPNPRYLFMSERHADALAHLLYGVTESDGFIQLTGEVGTGKTTLIRSLLEQLPEHVEVALILNSRLSPNEFLVAICEELRIAVPADRDSVKALVDALNAHLLAAHAHGRRVVLIVDEAQNLTADVLEQVRLLTNLETDRQKLLQIILIGQPELRQVLDRNDLRQLAQRITGRFHLEPLTPEETRGYVRHRLRVAGAAADIFTPQALREVHRLAGGVPRIINVICDRALLGAYARELRTVSPALARTAAGEVYGRRLAPAWRRWMTSGLVAAGACVLALGLWRIGESIGSQHAVRRAGGDTSAARAVADETHNAPAAKSMSSAVSDEPRLQALLEDHIAATGTDAAFTTLFDLWDIEFRPEGGRACAQAAEAGLSCVVERGSWGDLQHLRRPAILTLTDDAGVQYQVVLTGIGDEYARLDFGGRSHNVRIGSLSRYWFGDYLLVWRPQTERVRALTVGMRGADVVWLRDSLAALQGRDADPAQPELFDEGLAARVRDFQRSRRLKVDGIAGVRTQILLNGELDPPGTPRLVETG
ncbi:MAG TPA: AAA family ATPase [Gammaproteobacteria bacterium]|nr:AAA family ATPase [Gammaproteobacteria bacterium]